MSLLGDLFGSRNVTSERSVVLNVVGSQTVDRDYVNAIKTNRRVAREIYHNVNKNYSLGGQLVRPIVNNNVNFIGIPTLFGNKKSVKLIESLDIDYRSIHKSIEIDGSVLVWPQWRDDKVVLVKIPVDIIDKTFIDPMTKEIVGYQFKENLQYDTPDEINQSVQIICKVTKNSIETTYTGSVNKEVTSRNILGELPIVHFSNDKDDFELYGHSEIEPVEPQLRFYHNLTFEAGSAQSRDGHPKLKVTTQKPKQWIDNNFGAGAYENLVKNGGSISMGDRDLFINGEGDDVAYLYLNKTTGDYGQLSETTFSNIVEGSETPEINFGANIGTSLASVKEFRPVWIKKIEAKQYERTAPWLKVYELILKLYGFVNIRSFANDIIIAWPTPNFASVKEQSEIVTGFAKAFEILINKNVLSEEEIYDTIKKLDIFELESTFLKHKEIIDKEVEERDKRAADVTSASETTGDEGTKKGNENNNQTATD